MTEDCGFVNEPPFAMSRPHPFARIPFYYGWVVIAVAFVTLALSVSTRTAFSLLFPPLLDDLGWDRGVTAAAFSIGFLASTIYAPFSGIIVDRLGPRYLLPLGVLLVGAGMASAPFATAPWHLYLTLGVLVVGGSFTISFFGHSIFLPYWFVRRRGLAIGIAFAGAGVGSILILPWFQLLIEATGWRQACWWLAGILVVILVPLNFVFQRQRPEDIGLLPDGDPPEPREDDCSQAASSVVIVDREWASVDWTIGKALGTLRFWWLFAGYFCALYAWYAVQIHQTKYFIDHGISPATSALALGTVGLAGIVGQVSLGHLSDRIGREWAWSAACAGFMICYGGLLMLPSAPGIATIAVIVLAQGLLGYGLTSLLGAIPAEIFEGKGYSTIFGTVSVSAGLGAAVAPWATGALFDQFGNYQVAWWVGLGLSGASIAFIWLAGPSRVRRVGRPLARSSA